MVRVGAHCFIHLLCTHLRYGQSGHALNHRRSGYILEEPSTAVEMASRADSDQDVSHALSESKEGEPGSRGAPSLTE